MKNKKNVKATKLMQDDHIKVGGKLYRIRFLNLAFGRGKGDNVRIHLHSIKNQKSYVNLNVPASTTFKIYYR